MNVLEILMMQPQGQGGKGSGVTSLIMLVLIIAVFYLFFIRPQMKKTKEQKKFREALKKGDKVVTIGGIHGRIVEVQDTTFTIEVEGGVRLRIEKTAVASSEGEQIPQKS